MEDQGFIIKTSLIAFTKWAAVILLFLPLLALALLRLADLVDQYTTLALSRSHSFGTFFSLVVTGLQVLALIMVFGLWYAKSYRITKAQIRTRQVFSDESGFGRDPKD